MGQQQFCSAYTRPVYHEHSQEKEKNTLLKWILSFREIFSTEENNSFFLRPVWSRSIQWKAKRGVYVRSERERICRNEVENDTKTSNLNTQHENLEVEHITRQRFSQYFSLAQTQFFLFRAEPVILMKIDFGAKGEFEILSVYEVVFGSNRQLLENVNLEWLRFFNNMVVTIYLLLS